MQVSKYPKQGNVITVLLRKVVPGVTRTSANLLVPVAVKVLTCVDWLAQSVQPTLIVGNSMFDFCDILVCLHIF
jgi:hypothetical protein